MNAQQAQRVIDSTLSACRSGDLPDLLCKLGVFLRLLPRFDAELEEGSWSELRKILAEHPPLAPSAFEAWLGGQLSRLARMTDSIVAGDNGDVWEAIDQRDAIESACLAASFVLRPDGARPDEGSVYHPAIREHALVRWVRDQLGDIDTDLGDVLSGSDPWTYALPEQRLASEVVFCAIQERGHHWWSSWMLVRSIREDAAVERIRDWSAEDFEDLLVRLYQQPLPATAIRQLPLPIRYAYLRACERGNASLGASALDLAEFEPHFLAGEGTEPALLSNDAFRAGRALDHEAALEIDPLIEDRAVEPDVYVRWLAHCADCETHRMTARRMNRDHFLEIASVPALNVHNAETALLRHIWRSVCERIAPCLSPAWLGADLGQAATPRPPVLDRGGFSIGVVLFPRRKSDGLRVGSFSSKDAMAPVAERTEIKSGDGSVTATLVPRGNGAALDVDFETRDSGLAGAKITYRLVSASTGNPLREGMQWFRPSPDEDGLWVAHVCEPNDLTEDCTFEFDIEHA